MSEAFTGDWMGGGGCTNIGNVLHRSGSGCTPLQFRYMGHVPSYLEDAGSFSSSSYTESDRLDATV